MGYAGYVPAKLPPSSASPQEAAVQAVKSLDTLEVVGKLVYNCAVQPKEDKFRNVRLTNEKIDKIIVQCPGALDAMLALGWVVEGENLVIPAGKFMSMKEVRIIDAAKENLKRELKDQERFKK